MSPSTSDPEPRSRGEDVIAFFVFVVGSALLIAGVVWIALSNSRLAQDALGRAEQDAKNTAAQTFDRLVATPPTASKDAYRDALDPRAQLITFDSDDRRTELTIVIRESYDTYTGVVAHLRRCFDYMLFKEGAGVSAYHEVDCPEHGGRTFLDYVN